MKYCPWLRKKLKESPSLQGGEEVKSPGSILSRSVKDGNGQGVQDQQRGADPCFPEIPVPEGSPERIDPDHEGQHHEDVLPDSFYFIDTVEVEGYQYQ